MIPSLLIRVTKPHHQRDLTMSQSDSEDFFTPMEQIQKLTEEASEILANHRHRTLFFADCPECQLKRLIKTIHDEASKPTA